MVDLVGAQADVFFMLQEVADEVAGAAVHHHFHHRGAHAVPALLVAAAVSAVSTFGIRPGGGDRQRAGDGRSGGKCEQFRRHSFLLRLKSINVRSARVTALGLR